ncbi:MAG: glycosyltransferase family 39 protein [Veillonellales bacterium]
MRRWMPGLWLVIGVTGLVMFLNLGGIPLLDPDEPVYAETAKEMIAYNDFISPRIYGEYWYDKPPMYYWLVAAAYKIGGISEFTSRFPSALLAVFCTAAVYLSAARLFNQRTAVASGLILATSIEFFYLGKAAVTDITLTFFLTAALLAFIEKRYYWFYIFAGLATVTKGPVGLLFPGGIVFFYLLATGKWFLLKNMKIPIGILLAALVGLPWYYAMYRLHGGVFIDTFLGFHNITRFTSPEHPELVLWYFYIPVLLLGFFPWTAVMAQAVWTSLIKSSKRDFQILCFLNTWLIFIFLFFTISQTKLVSYILPMYPPLAIVTGWYVDQVWNRLSRYQSVLWSALLALFSLVIVASLLLGLKPMPLLQNSGIVLAAVLLLSACFTIFFLWRQRVSRAFGAQIIGIIVSSMVLFSLIFPVAAPKFAANDIGKAFNDNYDGITSVYIIKFLHPGFTFYTDVYGIELAEIDDLPTALQASQRAYFVIRQLDYDQLAPEIRRQLSVVSTSADKFLLLKQ